MLFVGLYISSAHIGARFRFVRDLMIAEAAEAKKKATEEANAKRAQEIEAKKGEFLGNLQRRE